MSLARVKNKATIGRLRRASIRLQAEIARNTRSDSHVSRALSVEGWWGGYAHAIRDVLLMAQSGVLPTESRVEAIWRDE